MKTKINLLILVALVFFWVKNGIFLLSPFEKPGIENVVRFCFIDTVNAEPYYNSITTFIILFSIIILGLVQVGTGLYTSSSHYRSMTFLRYGSKKKFLGRQIIKGIKNSLIIEITIIAVFLLSFYHVLGNNGVTGRPIILEIVFLSLNYFLFLNLAGLINIYVALKWNDFIAMTTILCFGGGLFVLDDGITVVNILTYGEISSLITGGGILMIFILVMSVVLLHYLKYKEVL